MSLTTSGLLAYLGAVISTTSTTAPTKVLLIAAQTQESLVLATHLRDLETVSNPRVLQYKHIVPHAMSSAFFQHSLAQQSFWRYTHVILPHIPDFTRPQAITACLISYRPMLQKGCRLVIELPRMNPGETWQSVIERYHGHFRNARFQLLVVNGVPVEHLHEWTGTGTANRLLLAPQAPGRPMGALGQFDAAEAASAIARTDAANNALSQAFGAHQLIAHTFALRSSVLQQLLARVPQVPGLKVMDGAAQACVQGLADAVLLHQRLVVVVEKI